MDQGSTSFEVASDLPPYARVPRWLVSSTASDGSVRLFAHLTRYENLPHGIVPSHATLADELGWSRSKVRRKLEELQDVKALDVEHRTSDAGDPTSNRYVLRYGGVVTDEHTSGHEWTDGVVTDEGRGVVTDEQQVEIELVVETDVSRVAGQANSKGATQRVTDAVAELIEVRDGQPPRRQPYETWESEAVSLLSVDKAKPDEVEAVCAWIAAGADDDAKFWRDERPICNVRDLRKGDRWNRLLAQYRASERRDTSWLDTLGPAELV